MTKLILHEIDGTDSVIMANPADEYFIMLQEDAQSKCQAKGIHLYKGENDTYYLADSDKVILATGMTTIRTYINYLL